MSDDEQLLIDESIEPLISHKQIICVTTIFAGIQFAWTIEFGYGTQFLNSLGLSPVIASLVWLAGPLSLFAFIVAV